MSHFTILGGRGFIGSHLADSLRQAGHDVSIPPRDAVLAHHDLGHVIYAIGVTSDFRERPHDTVSAHVCRLNEVLRDCQFESLLYLSSTRVYQHCAVPAGDDGLVDEESPLGVNPQRPSDLYNLSKLMGESLALSCGRPAKVVRLSNVYGPGDMSTNFLPSVVRAATTGSVVLETSPASAKDYVSLKDAVAMLPRIAIEGRWRVYNLSSGKNISHADLAERLTAATGCRIRYVKNGATCGFPRISNRRLRDEFDFAPSSLLDDLSELTASYQMQEEPTAC